MCGFSGFYDSSHQLNDYEQQLQRMGEAIIHRGPDDGGIWFDQQVGLGFSHRRLAIVDLSSSGHQPMASQAGRFVIAFNGEIYNHIELREELGTQVDGIQWRGHSDTETLLACIEAWGFKETLVKATGMFAIALWDKQTRTLSLARDRVGEKPLYYGWHNDCLIFGSELKALTQHRLFHKAIDKNALTLLLRHNYIPAPYCIWKNTQKLLPGTILTVDLQTNECHSEAYWSIKETLEQASRKQQQKSDEAAIDELEAVLSGAIAKQMVADVPLGAFLSGGIDSSVIVALMQAQSKTPIKTFSIGFHEKKYNEAEHAKAVANHIGTDHTELYVSAEDALEVVPKLATMYDEPFADSSGIPTYLVSKMAKEKVTVSLSGDAGDEIFCGYNRYVLTHGMWSKIKYIPVPLRKLAAKTLTALAPATWDKLGHFLEKILPGKIPAYFGDKIHKGAGVLSLPSIEHLYKNLVSLWHDPSSVVLGAKEPETVVSDLRFRPKLNSHIEGMMGTDMMSYLPDDILVKVDRAAMAVSLETRVPFLDHHLIEHAWQIPMNQKIRNGKGKWVLREVLYRHVPKKLIERPKMGFGIPLEDWLRGPLKPWAEELLARERLLKEKIFCPQQIAKKWEEHQSGKRNWSYHLWTVLMFQAWLTEQGELSE
ncbi:MULTISPECIES: asparagine synthase (glutamine-hydrolyzing) [Pseudoalteromonas]|uniref:asparagine synthase (glutamine-hydrolyzing) n=1 Tax=Pseudoalteromonas amylolytica TaxID=1859457 RepID=A0A1S1MZX3_9GAMM|nr:MULTISPECIES: asparagine synthase (glutamine-hydrolyzing) [Pseudoalteromonas]OHU90676.1 asparagine synthase (glutamine-hydrolyzing) [Pseudoalteromonas sp. JW3]OHU92703.1 asparagine synthase (glutamine-hydrolyzing) [Pseudoalteromonas amylolytica]